MGESLPASRRVRTRRNHWRADGDERSNDHEGHSLRPSDIGIDDAVWKHGFIHVWRLSKEITAVLVQSPASEPNSSCRGSLRNLRPKSRTNFNFGRSRAWCLGGFHRSTCCLPEDRPPRGCCPGQFGPCGICGRETQAGNCPMGDHAAPLKIRPQQ